MHDGDFIVSYKKKKSLLARCKKLHFALKRFSGGRQKSGHVA